MRRPGSMAAVCHVDAPPLGSVLIKVWPVASPATHREVVGHEMAVIQPPTSIRERSQYAAPSEGATEVSTSPPPSPAAQKFAPIQLTDSSWSLEPLGTTLPTSSGADQVMPDPAMDDPDAVPDTEVTAPSRATNPHETTSASHRSARTEHRRGTRS
jgi:hypothetical protein